MNNYTTYSDEQLLALLRINNELAYTELYYRYWKKMFYKAGQKLNNLQVAEEIIQDIFLDIWSRRHTLEVSGNFHHYLAAALKYKIINQQAKEYREAKYLRTQHLKADNSTQEQLNARELQNKIATLVSRLPEKCRMVYELKEQGLSQKQISRQMQISENTVETHTARALRVLRTNLGNFFSFFL